jgi:hypothetical protein
MTKAAVSIKLKSLYVTRFLLEMFGILLLAWAIFCCVLFYGSPRGGNGGHGDGHVLLRGMLLVSLSLICGIGLLLPRVWAKLCSSLLLLAYAIWTFFIDAYRWSNLRIYAMFLVPLLLTFGLKYGYTSLHIRRLPSANQL